MRITEKGRGFFRGTHKGADIEIERDHDIPGRKFYIRVRHANGGMMYDGYSPEGIETMAEAKREAIRGACLDQAPAMTLASLPVAAMRRYRGPRGGWIAVAEKPAGWPSDPLYDASTLSSLQEERDALKSERAILISTKRDQLAALTARAERAEAQLKAAREALEPFSRVGDIFELRAGNRPNADDDPVTEWEDHRVGVRRLTVGDFRRARSLQPIPEEVGKP